MKRIILLSTGILLGALAVAQAEDIKPVYEKECVKCHGPDGKGETKMGKKLNVKDYTDAKVQAEMKEDQAFKSIKEGIKSKDDKTLMKPAEGLSDDQIKALIAHMRTFKK